MLPEHLLRSVRPASSVCRSSHSSQLLPDELLCTNHDGGHDGIVLPDALCQDVVLHRSVRPSALVCPDFPPPRLLPDHVLLDDAGSGRRDRTAGPGSSSGRLGVLPEDGLLPGAAPAVRSAARQRLLPDQLLRHGPDAVRNRRSADEDAGTAEGWWLILR